MKNDQKHPYQLISLLEKRKNQDMVSQISEAGYLIEEIDSIDSKSAYSIVSKRMQRHQKSANFLNILIKIAAVLFIPALIASIWLYNLPKTVMQEMTFAMQEISSPPGVRSHIVLPDGSQVWLNAESSLKFRLPFDRLSRDVTLTGEAYFNVKKNVDVPFVVLSGEARVRVFGTSFNFKAFEEEKNIEVVLAEGNVSLNTEGKGFKNEQYLKPGDRVVFNKNTNQVMLSNGNVEKYTAWHKGKLVFDETPMPEVATQLARWYGIDVIINDPKILKYRITTTFDNESLHQVLELLRLSSPLKIEYIPATVDVVSQESKRSKVIITRKV